MAEVTWKSTLVGAFILFLIGLVVATAICYANVALKSIKAGLDGPYQCTISKNITAERWCNDTGTKPEDCVYVFVNYTSEVTSQKYIDIKFSLSYVEENDPDEIMMKEIQYNGFSQSYGKCSADYCGLYRLRNEEGEYKTAPPFIREVNKAMLNSTPVHCYLNPKSPADGAYLYLNHNIAKASKRLFRYYEGWAIFVTPLVVSFGILICIAVAFIRGDLAAPPVERLKQDKFGSVDIFNKGEIRGEGGHGLDLAYNMARYRELMPEDQQEMSDENLLSHQA